MTATRLTLLIPGLLQPPVPLSQLAGEERPAFKALNLFFNRARHESFVGQDMYQTLFHLFGLAADEENDLPIAALTRLVDSQQLGTGWTLRCDPASVYADMDRVVLLGHDNLELGQQETEQLLMIINAHVEQDGWQIDAHTAERWYVKGSDKTRVRTTPPQVIFGQDIRHGLPQGADGAYWCSIMNELQMLLHESPMNQARQARGLLPINSLWFWGGGQLPDKTGCRFDKVFANDPLATGLAMHNDCIVEKTDAVWQHLEQSSEQHFLLVLDQLAASEVRTDLFSWLDCVQQLEQSVIEKLMNLLKQKQLSEIILLDGHGSQFTLTAKQLRCWWKRGAEFSSLIEKAEH